MAASKKGSDPLAALRVKDQQSLSDKADWASLKYVWVPDEREGLIVFALVGLTIANRVCGCSNQE